MSRLESVSNTETFMVDANSLFFLAKIGETQMKRRLFEIKAIENGKETN